MKKLWLLLFSVCSVAAQAAPAEGKTQYIADDVTVIMREQPRTDATIRAQLRSGMKITVLQSLGLAVNIDRIPNEVPDPTRFDEDVTQRPYDPHAAHSFWRACISRSRPT